MIGVLEGAVVKILSFPPYTRPVITLVVRVLLLDVDVVVLHLLGGSFWRRVS